MVSTSEDLRARGLVHQVTDEALYDLLDAGGLTAYIGFDPTADSLHVGNLLQLCTLRRLQLGGHRPIALAGGGTGMIGDPGGKDAERPLLSAEALDANVASIRLQLARFLDFEESAGPAQALLLDNAQWLGELRLLEFLRETGKHFTVNQMVAKESVRARLERPDQGISYTEFSYMLLQAYDFLRLNQDHGCTLQLGGSDQWGNITMGVELVKKRAGAQAFGLTTPLVTKADGTKFGKSTGGNERVWLDRSKTSPFALYQFFLQSEDAVVGAYLRFFTFLALDELDELDRLTAERPQLRSAQRALAASVVDLVHGIADRQAAEEASEALFGGSLSTLEESTFVEATAEVPTIRVDSAALAAGISLIDLLAEVGLVASKGEARRVIDQRGAFVNDQVREGLDATVDSRDLIHHRFVVLRKGKRSYALVSIA